MLELHLGLVGQCQCRVRDDVHLVVMVTDRYMSACYALKYPERVSHLVLASPAGGLAPRGEIDRHVVFGVVHVCTGLTWAPQTAHVTVTEWQIEGAMHALVSVPIKSQEAEDRMKERMQRWYMGSLLGCIVNHHRHETVI